MSLIVYPYCRNLITGAMDDCHEPVTAPHNGLFGFEQWRKTVWSSQTLKNLNLELLPMLAHGDIFAEYNELDKLLNEINLVMTHSNQISKELNLYQDSFEFRLKNAFEAIRIAKKYDNGGVYIG